MTREHRRVVFLKLEEVYLDEKAGYSAGWTDARVATDLGVPRAWVSKIRDENFGPGTSEEIETALAAAKKLDADISAFRKDVAALIARDVEIQKRADTVERMFRRIEQAVR